MSLKQGTREEPRRDSRVLVEEEKEEAEAEHEGGREGGRIISLNNCYIICSCGSC